MGGPELWQSPDWRKPTHAKCRPFSGERNRDENNYQEKNNIFTDSWGQLVSQGEVLVARALHREAFVILWMLIHQLSACFKGTQAVMFSSAPFPSRWPKFPCLTIRLPICLVWLLTVSGDVVVVLQLQREEDGRLSREEELEGGGDSKTLLSISMQALLPREIFCLYRFSLGKKGWAKCEVGRTEVGDVTRCSKS